MKEFIKRLTELKEKHNIIIGVGMNGSPMLFECYAKGKYEIDEQGTFDFEYCENLQEQVDCLRYHIENIQFKIKRIDLSRRLAIYMIEQQNKIIANKLKIEDFKTYLNTPVWIGPTFMFNIVESDNQ